MKHRLISICLAAAIAINLCTVSAWAGEEERAAVQAEETAVSSGQQTEAGDEVTEAGQAEETEQTVTGSAVQENGPAEETAEDCGSLPEEAPAGAEPEEITVYGAEPEEVTVYGTADQTAEDGDGLLSADSIDWDAIIQGTVEWMKAGEELVLNDGFLSGVSSTSTDWYAFSLGRLGIEDNYSGFLAAADLYVREMYEQNPSTGLSPSAATEWHRLTVAVLAAGGDPTSVGGQDLIEDGVYNSLVEPVWYQGINGAIWALLALDTNWYETPEDARYDRETLVEYILDNELRRGGWAFSGSTADADMTAMAVYALAPYYAASEEVRDAVDGGLEVLRDGIEADGDLQSYGTVNCESTAQAIVAFCAMGIDPATVVSEETGNSLLDGLAKYYNTETGGFRHVASARNSDNMATGQAMYAIAAYKMYQQGISVWDFRSPANTAEYVASAGEAVYVASAGADAVLQVGEGVSSIQLLNVPVGNYDMAVVSVGDTVYGTAFGRQQDGNTPVTMVSEGGIPVEDGTVITIAVTRQDGTEETWTLTVQEEASAEVQSLIRQIESLPEAEEMTLDDAEAVEAAKAAYDRLTEEEQAQVENFAKLEGLLSRLEELREEEEAALAARREELEEEILAIQTPVGISNKNQINQYLLELEELGEWEGRAALEELLNGYMADIAEREALVAALDQDIWDQIDPLRVSQEDADTVQALMVRYSTLRTEEQELLSNGQSLLDAAGIVQALAEGRIPARVFQNLRSTGETFVYYGETPDGAAYTLVYDGATVQAAADVDAGVSISEDTGNVDGAVLVVEFAQEGSLNGEATLRAATDAAAGSYTLYWFNPDSLTIQSAGTGEVSSGYVEMTVSMGGRYWLSSQAIRVDGESGTAGGIVSGGGQTGEAASGTGTGSSGSASGGTTGTGSTGNASASASGSQQTSGGSTESSSGTASASGQSVTVTAEEGVMSREELEGIQGDRSQNLQTSGSLTEDISYTVTVNGEDVENTEEFTVSIRYDCGNAEDIRALAASPLILCMEEMGTFPGTLLFTLTTDLEDGNQLLFRFDPEERRAEYVKTVTIENGEIAFTLEEGGDYFIARRALAGSLNDPDTEEEQQVIAAETEEFGTPTPWTEDTETVVTGTAAAKNGYAAFPLGIAGGAAALVAAGGAVLYIRRKRGKTQ